MDNENLSGEFILDKKKEEHSEEKPEGKTEETKADHASPAKTHNPVHFYSEFIEKPSGIEFEGKSSSEEILFVVRAALITNVPWLLVAIILVLAPIVIIPLISFLAPQLLLSTTVQIIILGFYYLVIFGFVLVEFTIWYFNVAFLTNSRLVDVDVDGILYRNVSETKLDLIEDVSYTQIGVIRSIFNYGDIFVQTAGSIPNFEFYKAHNPAKIVHIIQVLIGKHKDDAS